MIAALDAVKADASVRAVLLTGEGAPSAPGRTWRNHRSGTKLIQDILTTQYNPYRTAPAGIPKPVVAAVNGVAAGAGARTSPPATSRGRERQLHPELHQHRIDPDSGGTFTLPRLVGMQRAFGQMHPGPEIERQGGRSPRHDHLEVRSGRGPHGRDTGAARLATMPTKAIARVTKQA